MKEECEHQRNPEHPLASVQWLNQALWQRNDVVGRLHGLAFGPPPTCEDLLYHTD
jgi:hypothetical protein